MPQESTATQLSNTTPDDAVSFLRDDLRRLAENLPPELKQLTETELFALRKPTAIDVKLRKSLWKSVETAKKHGFSEITQISIYQGLCTQQGFLFIIANPHRLAYILLPISTDREQWEEILALGLQRMREEILTMPAPQFLRAMEYITDRVHGPMVQKVEAKHAHLNMNKPIEAIPKTDPDRVASLQQKLRDVTPQADDENK